MAKIRYVQDKDDVIFYPITHERAVRDNNGINLETKLGNKQDTLVSGTNIKTINNQSLLGSGNITIQGGGVVPDNVEVTDHKVTTISSLNTNTQYPSAKAVYDYVEGMEEIIGDIGTLLYNIEHRYYLIHLK